MSPKSCSKGFKSAPSLGAIGNKRSKGLLVNNRNAMNPVDNSPITPSTRACNTSGKPPPSNATARVQVAMIKVHNRNEPSCAPQMADSL